MKNIDWRRPQCLVQRRPDSERTIVRRQCDARYHPDPRDCPLMQRDGGVVDISDVEIYTSDVEPYR